MTNTNMPQKSKPKRDPVQTATKIGLAVVFVLGVVLVFMGYRAQVEYSNSGFSSENAYQVIYQLSRDVSRAWQEDLQPEFNKLSESERESLNQITAGLVRDAWENQKKGSGEDVSALISGNEELSYKLLYTAYLVNGPKVSASNRKAITALSGSSAAAGM